MSQQLRGKAQSIDFVIANIHDKLNTEDIKLVKLWEMLFGNQTSVNIDVAQEVFGKLLYLDPNNEKVRSLVSWLSLNGTTVSLDDLKRLWTQLGRNDYKFMLGDTKMSGYKEGGESVCESFLGKTGLRCIMEILYKVSHTEGFFNITEDAPVLDLMQPCEYIFRKSTNSQYLFAFLYKDQNGNPHKEGIMISRSDKSSFKAGNQTYSNFESLKDALLRMPCKSGVRFYRSKETSSY